MANDLRKELGRIDSFVVGFGGDQCAQLGYWVALCGKSWGVSTGEGVWAEEPSATAEWTESDQDEALARCMRAIGKLLQQAQVFDTEGLIGIPVEATFEGQLLKDWRILEEVL